MAKRQPWGEICMFRAGDFSPYPLPWGIRTLCVKLRGLGDVRVRWFSYHPPCLTELIEGSAMGSPVAGSMTRLSAWLRATFQAAAFHRSCSNASTTSTALGRHQRRFPQCRLRHPHPTTKMEWNTQSSRTATVEPLWLAVRSFDTRQTVGPDRYNGQHTGKPRPIQWANTTI